MVIRMYMPTTTFGVGMVAVTFLSNDGGILDTTPTLARNKNYNVTQFYACINTISRNGKKYTAGNTPLPLQYENIIYTRAGKPTDRDKTK